jgi:hypothetical protein
MSISFVVGAGMDIGHVEEVAAAQGLPQNLADQVSKEDPGSQVVSEIQGYFNGDGQPDYALLLKERMGWRVKAYHAQINGPYVAFDLEDFGTDPDSPTAWKPEQFKLVLVKKGEVLNINGRLVPRATHAYDAIELVKIDDPGTATFYDWSPVPEAKFEFVRKNGAYATSGFGELGNE